MSAGRRWLKRLRPLVTKDAVEREMDEELAFHLEMEAEKYRAAGLSDGEARRRAALAFGGMERHREGVRESRWIAPLENLLADVRFALRQFRRAPFSRTAMLLILSMGIAVNTALYSRVQAALTRPAPGVPRDESLVRIRGAVEREESRRLQGRMLRHSEVLEYAGLDEFFSDVAASRSASVVVDPGGDRTTVPARAYYVTGNYFSTLGISPVAGPGLPLSGVDEVSDDLLAVISHSLWTTRFGGSPDAVGSTIRIEGVPVEIVGVAPPRFHGVDDVSDEVPSVWLPLGAARALTPAWASASDEPDPARLEAFARLREGVDRSRAEAAVDVIASRIETRSPGVRRESPSADLVPLLGGNSLPSFEGNIRTVAAVLGIVTVLILLVTCTNVAGLLVSAALGRRREIATRLSLGASRGRVLRQLLTESVALSVGAGILALAMLWSALRFFGRYNPDFPFELDWKVASFTFGFAILTGLVFGLSPALHASRAGSSAVLKDSAASVSGSRSRLHQGLVVAQIAVSQPLLVGLGAAVLLVGAELRAPPQADVLERIVDLQFRHTSETMPILEARAPELIERLRGVPGVVDATLFSYGWTHFTLMLPASGSFAETGDLRSVVVQAPVISPGYVELLDVPLRGRASVEGDLEDGSTPIVLDTELARELWGDADPIGRRIGRPDPGNPGFTVVGVIDDSRLFIQSRDDSHSMITDSGVYSLTKWSLVGLSRILVRTEGPPEGMMPLLRSITSEEVPEIAISEMTTLAATDAETRRYNLRVTGAVAAGAVLALTLAAVGLYSLIALSVRQRRREIGIRTAVGGQPRQVVGMFFRGGLKLSLIGLALGLPLSLYTLRLFTEHSNIPLPSPPLLYSLIGVTVVGVAALASWIPAHRAVAGDPTLALRTD